MSPVVTIHAEVGASIHFTTDGSTPTANSPVYNSVSHKDGIRLRDTTTIKAIAVKKRSSSAVSQRVFVVSEQGPVDVVFHSVHVAVGAVGSLCRVCGCSCAGKR